MSLALAVAGGVTLIAWTTMVPTARWLALTVVLAQVYDDVFFEGSNFDVGDLMIVAAVALGIMGAI